MKTSHWMKPVRAGLGLMIAFSITASAFAQDAGGFTATPLTPDSIEVAVKPEGAPLAAIEAQASGDSLVSVIVKLDDASLAAYQGGLPGLPATSPVVTGQPLDVNSAASQLYLSHLAVEQGNLETNLVKAALNAQITERFDIVIGGVAVVLPANQVGELAKLPGVQAIYPDEVMQLDTDRSTSFIGAPTTWNKLGGQESAAEGVIVGVIDTGIWPEHPSFSDPDPSGKPYAAPPAPPVGTRACQFGSAVPGDAAFACNNKLIGGQRFMSTYQLVNALLPDEYRSTRDDDGHGTHTASTSAGNAGVAASIFGVPRGIVSGVAPRAHVMAYKVCGAVGCYSSDSAAAIQEAIRDGVNVLNFSISGGANPYSDAVSLAFLDAYNAGIFVAASAGNAGPGADTTDHREPWVTTVAASTTDRAFKNTLTLSAGANSLQLSGTSITAGVGPAPVVVPADAQCNNPFPAGSVAGQIVVCRRGTTGRAQKGYNVLQGGAAGMILYNQSTAVTDLETDNHFLPTTHIQFTEGQQVLAFLAANPGATATLTAGVKSTQQGDVIASFSSRGGPGQSLGVSKPDITAPGVQVLAGAAPGHLAASEDPALGPQGELFQAIAGTSMSSPHIAGSGALIKALHPTWTPGQIKSALMTTAFGTVYKEDGVTPATPFDTGSGRVDLRKAWDPGITFSDTGANYVALQNELWKANYPSLYVPVMPGLITVQRTAQDVSGFDSHYVSSVQYQAGQPSDFRVIAPSNILIHANGTATFDITVDARDVPIGQVRHAVLILREKNFGCVVRFPITIQRKQPTVTMTKQCDPATFPQGGTANCSITIVNNTFSTANVNVVDQLPRQLQLLSVNGATQSGNGLTFTGQVAGAQPPDVTIASDPGGSPAGGYLPLSLFGITPIAGMGDETAANFNVPAFTFGGQTYTRIGMVSNGYAVVGGTNGAADIQFINQALPNPTRPNNVLAPFWTDLNPAFGGAMRISTLTDGVNTWIVMDWQGVREYSTNRVNSFQIWVRIGAVQDITYTYGTLQGNGDLGFVTVGAENSFGNRGANYYVDGTGTLPTSATELRVSGSAPQPGETKVITYQVKGVRTGKWVNYAEMTGDLWFGTNIARFAGEVTKP